ncbi:FAD-binding oxidoreductase [Brachybacterium sp. J153]|uniref:FAD-binding oxidoreductase n=1 Tax=Brachybacterium sp. J153 TaxID=3116488 RepID=UPI002E7854EB|nr:FAD-binding oxidoreductase [Brachybacterium sp. J153]MEE1617916.1 FAD-binding oxidoreductase [Brachybacterium sp. J153]
MSNTTAADVKRHKWWGWGLDDVSFSVENRPAFVELAQREVGVDLIHAPAVAEPDLSAFDVPASRLPDPAREALVAALGETEVRTDDEFRVLHSFGRSLPDLFRVRTGDFGRLVDAIVYPGSEEDIAAVLRIVLEQDLVLIPYGGGSCISGSVTPDLAEERPVVTMNLGRMNRILEIDDTSGLARIQPGMYGPDMEEQLQEQGWTVGHFPDSFTYSTVGGWAATRSSGMQSDKYGDIEDIVRGLRMVHPDGVAVTKPIPGRDSGPSVHEMILGSEGRLGVISEVTVQVHRRTPVRQVIGYMYPDWEHGIRGMHAIARSTDVSPTFTRLSDGPETKFSLALSSKTPTTTKAKVSAKVQDGIFAYLRSQGWDTSEEMCLSYVCFEGSKASVEQQKAIVKKIVKANGGVTLGASVGKVYDQKKFDTPYLRDFLLNHRVFGDVCDTGATWGSINEVHAKVYEAFERTQAEQDLPGFMFCHMSHSYHAGACLYFTFAFPYSSEEQALEQYYRAKSAVQQTFVDLGSTVSHHHAVGIEHRPWIEQDLGPVGRKMVEGLFAATDPGRNLNPGKVVEG